MGILIIPMGLFGKKKNKGTKCPECGVELHTSERLQRHLKKAHGNVPEKKMDPGDVGGSVW